MLSLNTNLWWRTFIFGYVSTGTNVPRLREQSGGSLEGEAAQAFKERMLGEGPWEEGEDADDMWLKIVICVRKVASEVFGVSRGGKQEGKDTWWWNDEVQRAIKEKKECFKRLHLDKSAATSRAIN